MQRDILRRFILSERRLLMTRRRGELLYEEGSLLLQDIESIYAGLFIRAVGSVEALLEALFLAIVTERTSFPARARIHPRVAFPSERILRDVLLGGKPYVDWLPYARTIGISERYLVGGHPFTDLAGDLKSKIPAWVVTRHALAHTSVSAREKFVEVVIASKILPPRERTPAGFLRSEARIGPHTTQFELFLGEMMDVAQALCNQ
jgi:hypothetical protein